MWNIECLYTAYTPKRYQKAQCQLQHNVKLLIVTIWWQSDNEIIVCVCPDWLKCLYLIFFTVIRHHDEHKRQEEGNQVHVQQAIPQTWWVHILLSDTAVTSIPLSLSLWSVWFLYTLKSANLDINCFCVFTGPVPLSIYMRIYKKGDIVDIKARHHIF